MDVGLLKYSAKDYFFKALVCWFCNDRQGVDVSCHGERERGRGGRVKERERERVKLQRGNELCLFIFC